MCNFNQIKNNYSPKTSTPVMQPGNNSSNRGDMSRRKQKNPKPFFTSREEHDRENHEHKDDGENNNLNTRYLNNIFFFEVFGATSYSKRLIINGVSISKFNFSKFRNSFSFSAL
jgi:hypothetical protein